ncbi:ABC transporter permease subunit [Paraferrimonas haliotis]|uniref:ABC high affinity phosphate uptake system permease PstC n=1 Tax=Paraferrimonas haliotis TaxID=2013866 RepID=A0AA37TRF7_9GAMM|nr:ABC transporter permease subunit [Paraferrimonas haliotis]GLS82947.1 ABC high affinity phosphate uptake system permease PstC [Paraferrimonas haliotis]
MNQQASQAESQSTKSIFAAQQGRRRIKDKLTQYSVSLGGIAVLFALVLIFIYLAYIVKPLFDSATISSIDAIEYTSSERTLALGADDQAQLIYRVTDSGRVEYFDSSTNNRGMVRRFELPQGEGELVSYTSTTHAQQQLQVFGNDRGQVLVVQPSFRITYPNDVRQISPLLRYPLKRQWFQVDEQHRSLELLASAISDDTLSFAYLADHQLQLRRKLGQRNVITGEAQWQQQSATIAQLPMKPERLLITPDQRQLLLQNQDSVYVYDISQLSKVSLQQVIDLSETKARVTDIKLLAGASSILIAREDGSITQWFEVNQPFGRGYQNVRSFDAGFAVQTLVTEHYRKGFAAYSAAGEMTLFYSTSERELVNLTAAQAFTKVAAFNPRANRLLIDLDGVIQVFSIVNEHPEISWSALWQKVWYEGYQEPDYVWQSTSANQDFEAKLSLTPLLFGTIKAAAYAMLFAIPIAVAGAIYTAYFMTAGVRRIVKPTIEIMEALPTVILGFLAGLWLAPIVETHLSGFLLMLILLPSSLLLTAMIWWILPAAIKARLPENYRELLLIPLLLIVGYSSLSLSPTLELWLFNGDSRSYITNEWGIGFDQRNALVVGIAMGFAVIPTIFSIAEDAIFSVPKHLSNGSLALGATQWQTLTRVILLTASPGIFSAIMMGVGRAIGETMIVLMATGNTPLMDWSILEGMRTLAANIAIEMPESELGSTHYRVLFLAALALLVMTFLFNTVAELIRQRLRDKYRAM